VGLHFASRRVTLRDIVLEQRTNFRLLIYYSKSEVVSLLK